MTSVGIDLGTTNSAVGFVEGEDAELIEIDSAKTMRSVLTFAKRADGSQDEVIVGNDAVDYIKTDPEETVSAVKRHMGDNHPYEFAGEELTYTPEMLSGLILKKVIQEAEAEIRGDVDIDEAVITVPARFSEIAKSCTKAAAYFGYIDHVPMLLTEPSAACVAYKIDDDSSDVERAAVYDFGGGTFDISIVNIVPDETGGDRYVVESHEGKQQLGGEDFDERLRDWLLEQFENETGIDVDNPEGDVTSYQIRRRVQEEAKNVKESFASAETQTATVPFLAGGESLEVDVSREQFIELTEDLVDETIELCDAVLDGLDYTTDDIDTLITVGGSTKMQQVQEAVSEFFGQDPVGGVDPDKAVALGAAEQAESLGPMLPGRSDDPKGELPPSPEENDDGPIVSEASPSDIGFELASGELAVLIEENQNYPVESEESGYSTVADYQTEALLRIYRINADDESEKEAAKKDVEHPANEHIKTFTLTDIRDAKAGVPDIAVRFELDNSGTLNAEAWDTSIAERSGIEAKIDTGDGPGESDGPYTPPTREEIIDGGLREDLPPVT